MLKSDYFGAKYTSQDYLGGTGESLQGGCFLLALHGTGGATRYDDIRRGHGGYGFLPEKRKRKRDDDEVLFMCLLH